MIDENKLMEEVRQWKRKVDKDCGEMPNVSYLTGYISALSVVEGMIAQQPTIEQYGTWIPCRERLPGITGIYQVCIYDKECKRKRVWYGQFVYPRYWFVYDMSGDSIPCEITHWMPLPELYREEKKDE